MANKHPRRMPKTKSKRGPSNKKKRKQQRQQQVKWATERISDNPEECHTEDCSKEYMHELDNQKYCSTHYYLNFVI